jgi:hypothetical protein
MARQTPQHLFTFLGWVAWGDFGPTTVYRNRKGKVVFYAKTWPKDPDSQKQAYQRDRFRAAAAAWQELPPTTHAQWDLACRRGSLCCNGYALFVHYHTLADTRGIRTIERQTHTTLLP